MKRLFYSTIAVLAFSVSGMANTIELDKLELNKNLESNIEEVTSDYCEERAEFIMNSIIDGGKHLDEDVVWNEAVWWGNVALALCKGYSFEQIVY